MVVCISVCCMPGRSIDRCRLVVAGGLVALRERVDVRVVEQ